MATFRVQAVEKFDFSKPEEWPRWIKRFERFRQVSDLVSKSEEIQISTLVYSMGDKAEDILESFELSTEDAKKYEKVKEKFEKYFVKKSNTIFERAKFNRRVQKEGESVDDFITDLHHLAANCGYKKLQDELIRDRIVVGIRDAKLSEELQMEADLTLEKAKTKARQSETVKKQQAVVRGEESSTNVDALGFQRHRRTNQKPHKKATNSTEPSLSCNRCGKTPLHGRQHCPAKEVTCHNCHKKGHYARCCKTRTVREILHKETYSSESDSEYGRFMGSITADAVNTSSPWYVSVDVNGRLVDFKIDTGEDVTVMPESLYQRDTDGPLSDSDIPLTGPTGQDLEVCGKIKANMHISKCESVQEVYVVKNLKKALLGRPAIESLRVATRVEHISEKDIVQRFPKVFRGLGKLRGDYEIRLKDDAIPFALSTPRRVAIPLLPKVKAELEPMETMGVITRVEEPTDWCAGIVVVPKPGGRVRICVDLTKLNESVCRERQILPSVEHTLAQIGSAKHFSKLDANSGYWQVPLHPESRKLTTFITPFGRFILIAYPSD